MAKTVFRPQETLRLESAYVVAVPKGQVDIEEIEEVAPIIEFEGPSADDLRREAELFKQNWEREKEAMMASARAEAQEIVARAEAQAFDEVKKKNDQALKIRREAEDAAEGAVKKAEEKILQLENESKSRLEVLSNEAKKQGFDQGREEGFKEGRLEVERLIDRLHVILERAMDKRAEILEQTESQVIELVLLIAKKVVKTISDNQKNVVLSNVSQALRKLKTRSDIIIRVNLADLQLTTEHKKELIAAAENVKQLTIVEDSSVDRGGCIIETDFGEIDARIQSQLHAMEEKILDISPIRTRGKAQE
ncbi:flagellar assembly protein FliH [Spirochaetota bacterium]